MVKGVVVYESPKHESDGTACESINSLPTYIQHSKDEAGFEQVLMILW